MANKKVTFSGQTASATVLRDLKTRIKNVFSSSSVNTGTPTSGSSLSFSSLNEVYTAARTALFALSGSFGSRSLSNFTGATISGTHGMGIVEKTVGDLEQLCLTFFSGNNAANNVGFRNSFTAEKNSSNFSGVNSTHKSPFTAAKNSSNFSSNGNDSSNRSSFTKAKNSSNFTTHNNANRSFTAANDSSNFSAYKASGNSSNRSVGFVYSYEAFHTARGGTHTTVLSVVYKTNFGSFGYASNRSSFTEAKDSSNFSSFGTDATNRSFTAAKNSGNFSGRNSAHKSFTAAVNSSNFSDNGSNSANKSFTAAVNSSFFVGNNSSFFASNAFTCKVVHSSFSVQGVDF